MITTKEIGDNFSQALKNFGNHASEKIQILEPPKPTGYAFLGVDDAEDADVRTW